MSNIQAKDLIEWAKKAREYSYCPYSGFAVGAALLSQDGQVFSGCNIENAAFSPSVCAERTAIFKAVSQGVKRFEAIAIVGGKAGQEVNDECLPCGVCRQVLSEFCGGDLKIYTTDGKEVFCHTLSQLLPSSFHLK